LRHPPLWAMGLWVVLVWAASPSAVMGQPSQLVAQQPSQAAAQQPSRETPVSETAAVDTGAQPWSYTLGGKFQIRDVADASTELSMRPVLGLRYGRWRFGHPTGTDWLRFSGYRKEANLAYQLREDERLKVGLSMRILNFKDNGTYDGFSSGQNTLVGRVSVNYKLHPRWTLGSDLTQDLMGRGNGTTLSVGTSYALPLDERSALNLSAGLNWATATHWATEWRLAPTPGDGWHSGLGSLGLGLSYRYALTPQWAWFGTLGTVRPLGQVHTVSPHNLNWTGQVGLLYFSR